MGDTGKIIHWFTPEIITAKCWTRLKSRVRSSTQVTLEWPWSQYLGHLLLLSFVRVLDETESVVEHMEFELVLCFGLSALQVAA